MDMTAYRIKSIRQELEKLETEITQMRAAISNNESKARPLENCNLIQNFHGAKSERYYQGGSFGLTFTSSPRKALVKAQQHLAELWQQSQAIHTENVRVIKANTQIRTALTGFMDAIGFPTKKPKAPARRGGAASGQEAAGWVADMERWLPVNDRFESITWEYERHLDALKQWEQQITRDEIVAEQAKIATEKAEKAEQLRAVLAVKYALTFDVSLLTVWQHLEAVGTEEAQADKQRLSKYWQPPVWDNEDDD